MTDAPGDRHVTAAQDAGHHRDFDYEHGSPHLRHASVRGMVETRLHALVDTQLARTGSCRVLEIGAGHGTFTRTLLDVGATAVTVSEASAASAATLEQQFGQDDRVRVLYDESGDSVLAEDASWDAAVMISVLHHIPDYLGFVGRLAGRIVPGGSFLSVQDPLWYPRRRALTHVASRGSYLAWRLLQGEYRRGLATRVRRARGIFDENEPSDLVEYHVVRQGVDEVALVALLSQHFGGVELWRYWSSQAPVFQRMGERTSLVTDFGLFATQRLE